MRSIPQAIEKFCSYFEREIGEIGRLVGMNGDDAAGQSASSSALYKKVLYVTMLDTLAGIHFHKSAYPELSRLNNVRFSRFVVEHCSWPEANFVSLPFLLDKLKLDKLEGYALGQFIAEKLSRFSTEDGGEILAMEMDDPTAALLQRAATEKEEAAIYKYEHIALLYRYRNRLVHESRQPGYAMDGFAEGPASYYHGYLGMDVWHLGYPLAMFELLTRNGLASFRSHLEANATDPYAALDETRRW